MASCHLQKFSGKVLSRQHYYAKIPVGGFNFNHLKTIWVATWVVFPKVGIQKPNSTKIDNAIYYYIF